MMTKSKALVIERTFDAPRELVWKAFTEPERVKKWWGPKGFIAPDVSIDLKVGGKFLYSMAGPDGQKRWTTGEYKEIVPMEKIVSSDYMSNEDGDFIHPSELGFPTDDSDELILTYEFEDVYDGKTKVTLTHTGWPEGQAQDMAGLGYRQAFDKLAASLQ